MSTATRSSPREHYGSTRGKHLLIVEDSKLVIQILNHLAQEQLPSYVIHFASNFSEGCALYQQHKEQLFAAIVDLNLPDAPNGEMASYLLDDKLPVIVLTGNYSDDNRNMLLQQGVVDYVIKESRYSYEYTIGLVSRLAKNLAIQVLVVEDSRAQQAYVKMLLEQHMYQVITAKNGVEALEVLAREPDIRLLITDYNMPEMDGFELTKALRRNYSKTELIIIGLSGDGNNTLSAQFIKNGANDFLRKPFIPEEFHCRITHNIESQEHSLQIQNWAFRDPLTNLYNRRYLFEQGTELHRCMKKQGTPLSVAVIDIDHFKKINDSYGHDVGDKVLTDLAAILSEHFAAHITVRLGGEEFCIIMPGLNNTEATQLVDQVRRYLMANSIGPVEQPLSVAISAGVVTEPGESIEHQINTADKLLYRAKESGRNVVISE